MFFSDTLTLDAPKRTSDGYLAVRARAARVGVYDYLASEPSIAGALPAGHSFKPTDIIKVLRDENTVFDKRAAGSFIGKPITDDHPSEAVNASNWRDHSRGVVMNALRDGEHLAFDLVLMDAATIAKVDAGKVELSNGYGATLEFGDFTAPDGTKCHARQSAISGNHVAIVDRGRAGSSCRIGDAKLCDSIPLPHLNDQEKPVKTMLIDGQPVNIANADTAQATIATILAARDEARAKATSLETQVATLTTEGATKDAKIVTLEQQVKDAKPTAAQLRDAGKALLLAADKAKLLGVTVTDAMDEAEIMAATVTAKMGDAAKDWSADQVAASFAVLTKDVKLAQPGVQPIGAPANVGDAQSKMNDAWGKSVTDINAWRVA